VKLVSCWDARSEAARAFAQEYGCQAEENLEALLGDPAVEAVAIYTPNNYHRQPAEAAAAAGKHVFTDKPIANTAQDAAAMIRACKKAGVTLMVGHSDRYHGAQRAIKSIIESGRLGTIAMAEAHTSHSGGARLSADEWRWRRADAPGGPLMQLSVHAIDTMHCFFGPTRRVTALSSASLVPSEIEDVFLTLLELESGLLVYVGTNYVAPPCSYFRIYGMSGNLYWEGRGNGGKEPLRVVTTPENPWTLTAENLAAPEINAHAAEMTEFARAIRTGTAPETGGKEALQALGVVLAALQSAEQGRAVEVREALGEAAALLR
jgi:predicted dehydrogenase